MRIVGRADVEGAFVGNRGFWNDVCGDAGGESVVLILLVVGRATEERVLKWPLRGRDGPWVQPATCIRLETKLATGMIG